MCYRRKTEKIDGKRYFSFENKKNHGVSGIGVYEVFEPGIYKPDNQMWSVSIEKNFNSGVIFQGRFEYGDSFESFVESKALSEVDIFQEPKPLIEGKRYFIAIQRYQPVIDSIFEFVH